jgi:chromosome segregation ATPase
MNDMFENKRKRLETIAKILGLCAVAFFVSPIIMGIIHGLIGLVIAALIGITVVSFMPAVAAMFANWRLKALKAVAAANPIETLENEYAQREEALTKIRQNITEFSAVVQELDSQIREHNREYPDRPSQFVEKFNKMRELLALRAEKYKQAVANLKAFAELIEEKRSDWKVAQSAAKAMKLANVGEDFQSKLMKDTALSTIQDGLNMAFGELEVSLLDEQPASQSAATATPQAAPATSKATAKNLVTSLDFKLEEPPSISPRQKIAVI